ncbi:DUF4113 domain-containing protein [Enterovibrio coralii]|nr:DUF4113 domain-containing protein [Enterovibrio coralii]
MVVQGFEQKWGVRRECLTPQYTTKCEGLVVERC